MISLRARVLAVVLMLGVAPLIVLGIWLSRATLASGEELLRDRLEEALARNADWMGDAWVRQRSAALDVVEAPPDDRQALLDSLSPAVREVALLDAEGAVVWSVARSGDPAGPAEPAGRPLVVELPFRHEYGGRPGTLTIRLGFEAFAANAPGLGITGAILGAFDARSEEPLLPLPFGADLLRRGRFEWAGDEWVSAYRPLPQAGVLLAATAPLTLFTGPFEESARQGILLLFLVAGAGFTAVVLLTRRWTRSLERLASTAEAVSAGDLDRRTGIASRDEVGRVAAAFDEMTESLRRTLSELSERRSLAALGEFAAALAHEIRNPLTSIKLDLQVVEEELPEGSRARSLQGEAIAEIDHLDGTVSGVLSLARSGRVETEPIDLRVPLDAAIRNARPAFDDKAAVLVEPPREEPVRIEGDAGALQRAFLNLLLNAAQALEPEGRAEARLDVGSDEVVVEIRDDGRGIDPDEVERVFESFYSSRESGTGLGLTIARRIAVAHGGSLDLESEPGEGTTIRIRLPLLGGTKRPARGDEGGTRRPDRGLRKSPV